MNSYKLVYYKGELGLWAPDCECLNCVGMEFIPKRFGPSTLREYRRGKMLREIYDPLIQQQLTNNSLLARYSHE